MLFVAFEETPPGESSLPTVSGRLSSMELTVAQLRDSVRIAPFPSGLQVFPTSMHGTSAMRLAGFNGAGSPSLTALPSEMKALPVGK
jgi:hypothetical protein